MSLIFHLKIIHDLFDGIRSDIKERVKLNQKKIY